jgi:Family of unknown function (DUF5691)
LQGSWPKESGADRKKHLELLREGLSANDIPALANWRNELSQTNKPNATIQAMQQRVTQYLLCLPDSELYQAWTRQLSSYFQGNHFVLPTTDDGFFNPINLVRDTGLSQRPNISDWFNELLEVCPPSLWTAASGRSWAETVACLNSTAGKGVNERLVKAAIQTWDSAAAVHFMDLADSQHAIQLLEIMLPIDREKYIMATKRSSVTTQWWSSPAALFDWSETFSQWVLKTLYQSWTGYNFSMVQAIMPLDVFLHPQTRPASIPGLMDNATQRNRWIDMVVPELEKMLAVKRVLVA